MDKQSHASSLAKFESLFVKPRKGRTLIVGSRVYKEKEDRRKRYDNVVGVDMLEGEGVDLVLNLEEPLPEDIGQFEHIECMSVLEHSRRPWLLAENIERLMAPGGTIFLSVPFIWRIHAYPSDYFRFTPEGIRAIMPGIEWDKLMLATNILTPGDVVGRTLVNGHPYLARTETVGFGVRA